MKRWFPNSTERHAGYS